MNTRRELSTAGERHLRFVLGIMEAIDLLVESDRAVSLRCIRVLADTGTFHAEHLAESLGMQEEAEATFR